MLKPMICVATKRERAGMQPKTRRYQVFEASFEQFYKKLSESKSTKMQQVHVQGVNAFSGVLLVQQHQKSRYIRHSWARV